MNIIFLITLIILILLPLIFLFIGNNYRKLNWDFIDKVIYINLEDRVDRRRQIESELSVFPKDRVIRFNAIKDTNGHLGCSKSHVECLKLAIKNNWKNVLIVEDDAMWYNYHKGYYTLKNIIKNNPNFDVITFGNSHPKFDRESFKLYEGACTSSYLVNNQYYSTLIANFEEGLRNLEKVKDFNNKKDIKKIENLYAIDQYWKLLQKKDNWFIVNPALMIQRPSKSSILKSYVDYKEVFNI